MLKLDHRILENPAALRWAGLVPVESSRSERAVAPSAEELSGSRGATSSTSPHRQTAKRARRKPVSDAPPVAAVATHKSGLPSNTGQLRSEGY